MSDKILIELHYWHGDQERMRQLVDLITKLEPGRNDRADILLTSRYDTDLDPEMTVALDAKFKTYLCLSPWVGEGEGNCYSWFASMSYALHGFHFGRMPRYKAILTADADCVPLTADWIDRLHAAWDAAPAGTLQVGAQVLSGGPTEHVNSNALWSGNPCHLRWFLNQIVGSNFALWFDMLMAPKIREAGGYAACHGMRSYWRQPTISLEQLEADLKAGVFFIHGIQDSSLRDAIRERLL
jgi:hypothetical protein